MNNKLNEKEFFKRNGGIIFLLSLLFISVLLAIRIGSAPMTTKEFFGGLFHAQSCEAQSRIIYLVRMPRVTGAVIAGAGLSVSGVVLQSVTGNELAAPNIIGINSGAGFAVILLLCFVPGSVWLSPIAAFFGAFLTTLIIISVASKVYGTGSSVILSGIAVTTFLNAGISFVSLLDSDVLSSYNYFSIGGLSGVRAEQLYVPGVVIAVCILCLLLLSKKIDTLYLGESVALSLGVRVKLLRLVCLVIASAAASAVVSFAGLLGFVGLVVPHISRKLCGNSACHLVPVSALVGSILVVLADLFGRTVFAPSEVPVGIIMAFIGAPFFFMLLIGRKRHVSV